MRERYEATKDIDEHKKVTFYWKGFNEIRKGELRKKIVDSSTKFNESFW